MSRTIGKDILLLLLLLLRTVSPITEMVLGNGGGERENSMEFFRLFPSSPLSPPGFEGCLVFRVLVLLKMAIQGKQVQAAVKCRVLGSFPGNQHKN